MRGVIVSFINALGKAAQNKQTKQSTLYAQANEAKAASAASRTGYQKNKKKSKAEQLSFKQMYFLSRP